MRWSLAMALDEWPTWLEFVSLERKELLSVKGPGLAYQPIGPETVDVLYLLTAVCLSAMERATEDSRVDSQEETVAGRIALANAMEERQPAASSSDSETDGLNS